MPRAVPLQRTPDSRVFTIEDGAGPQNAPRYQGLARAGAVDWPAGDSSPVFAPSRDQYRKFDIIDRIEGTQGLPTLPIEVEKQRILSEMLALRRKGCTVDLHVHIGACKNPTDFNQGYEVAIVLEGGKITGYSLNDIGAFEPGQDAAVIETVPFTGLDYYEVVPLSPAEIAASEIVQEIVDVAICDSKTCGDCGLGSSDGCQKVFALTVTAGGSPGLAAELIYSEDGGGTIGQTNVSTLAGNEEPSALGCVGTNLVVVSEQSASIHYAAIADILDGDETWAEVSTGFVGGGEPRKIFSLGRTFTWIVGAGGYVYFSDDVTSGVTVQSAGSVTVQDLNAIHGADELNLVAVGDSNAVLVTSNGGSTWASVTGPDVGVNLNAVWVKSKDVWFVGTAGGKLWYTTDAGGSWTEKSFPGGGAGVVRDIAFSTANVGYMAHDTATPRGRILRTIDGGFSWQTIPESSTSVTMPANDRFNAVAACADDPNVVYGGGLADNATDGILVKAA